MTNIERAAQCVNYWLELNESHGDCQPSPMSQLRLQNIIFDALAHVSITAAADSLPSPVPPADLKSLVTKIRAYHEEGVGSDPGYVVFDLTDEEAADLLFVPPAEGKAR